MQRQRCADFAKARGWQLVHVYEDTQSARTTNRPEFAKLRHELAQYSAVIFWKLDRMARRALDALQFVEECEAAGTAFVSVTDGFDTSTAMGRAAMGIAAQFAQLESDHTSERVRATQQQQLESGCLPWRAPYGYTRNGKRKAEINEPEAAIVRRIFGDRAEGWTQREIGERLRAQGMERRGRPWTRQSVADVVLNPAYIGSPRVERWTRDGGRRRCKPKAEWRLAPGLLPPIIGTDLWECVQRRTLRGKRPSLPAAFRGALVCGRCTARLHVRSRDSRGHARTVYMCEGRRRPVQTCHAPQISEETVRRLLHAELERLERDPSGVKCEFSDKRSATEEYGKAAARLERALELYVDGLLSKERLDEIRREMDEIQKRLNTRLPREATEQEVRAATAKIKEILGMKDIEAANRRLRQVVARIVVRQKPPGVELVLWAP